MDKWEYKVLFGLAEEALNKWGEVGYEIYQIILPPPDVHVGWEPPEHRARHIAIILKRRKP